MEKNTTNPTTPTTTAAPTVSAAPAFTEEELCGSTNILDTVHLKTIRYVCLHQSCKRCKSCSREAPY